MSLKPYVVCSTFRRVVAELIAHIFLHARHKIGRTVGDHANLSALARRITFLNANPRAARSERRRRAPERSNQRPKQKPSIHVHFEKRPCRTLACKCISRLLCRCAFPIRARQSPGDAQEELGDGGPSLRWPGPSAQRGRELKQRSDPTQIRLRGSGHFQLLLPTLLSEVELLTVQIGVRRVEALFNAVRAGAVPILRVERSEAQQHQLEIPLAAEPC